MRFAVAVLVAFVLVVGSASAAERDIRGTWICCTNPTGGAGNSTTLITSEDLNSGQWSGWGYGGGFTWPVSGTLTGNQFTATIPFYNELTTYSAQYNGTITGKRMAATWSDNRGQGGTWTATEAAAPPPPVAGAELNAKVVTGAVKIKLPGTTAFVDLSKVAVQLPVGTVVDTTNGTIALTAAQSITSKKTATADFYKGVFKIGQKATRRAVTDLALTGGSFAACGAASAAGGAAAAQKTKVRMLWGKGHGLFRTSGRYASATIRGTQWETVDYCDGTLVKVTQGAVTVRDIPRKRDVTVRAGHQYFARAKR